MAQAIRKICLKLALGLLRLCARPPASGWQRSPRSNDLGAP